MYTQRPAASAKRVRQVPAGISVTRRDLSPPARQVPQAERTAKSETAVDYWDEREAEQVPRGRGGRARRGRWAAMWNLCPAGGAARSRAFTAGDVRFTMISSGDAVPGLHAEETSHGDADEHGH